LKVIPGRMKEATLLTISSFQNAFDATEYLKTISKMKELFTSLGELKYEIYAISDENLKKLIESENMEEWGKFYQTYFVRRTPPAPLKPEDKTEKKIDENKKVPDTVLPISNIEQQKQESNINQPVKSTEVTQNKKTETIAVPADSTNLVKDTTSVIQSQKAEELYSFVDETAHNIVYMLPAQSSNQSLLITYLNRFNVLKYRNAGIEVVTEPFDDFRVMVIIKGFTSKEKAAAYFEDVKSDQRISMSLRNINYKSYLISNDNLQTLKTTKDIVEYQKFHSKNY
jgi:hypothetical protein